MDPYIIGYRLGCLFVDFFVIGTSGSISINVFRLIKNIAKDHVLSDTSSDGVSDNLFKCIEFID